MSENKKKTALALALFATFWFIVGGVCGFFAAKGMYDQPLQESVTRDTVTITDTVIQYAPKPVSVEKVRTEYKWLPVVRTDTVTRTDYIAYHDTALVEVPITSKHYHGENYDAYVSGFDVNIDSIFVYNETQVITETITRMKPPNRLSLDIEAGADYLTTQKDMATFAFGDLTYKIRDSRFAIGLRGGVVKMPTDKSQMFVGGVVKLKIF
jgi:hypothetical protein